MTVVVAVASGTSADGLDVAAVRITGRISGRITAESELDLEILHTATAAWPAGLAERLLALLPPATTTAAELCALDTAVGQAVGAVAAEAAAAVGGADLVVSPGQTVHHEVSGGRCLGTLQLGQPAWVARRRACPWCRTCAAPTSPPAGTAPRSWPCSTGCGSARTSRGPR